MTRKTKAIGHLCPTRGLNYVRPLKNGRHVYECAECRSTYLHDMEVPLLFLSEVVAKRLEAWSAK